MKTKTVKQVIQQIIEAETTDDLERISTEQSKRTDLTHEERMEIYYALCDTGVWDDTKCEWKDM